VLEAKAKPAPKPAEVPPAKIEKPAKIAKVAELPKPAKVGEAAPPAKGDWRIQLGAFSQKGSAEALYAKLSGKAALAGRHPYYISVGAITRLQVGPFESKAVAAGACKALGQACFPVAAK
jgi:cell division septation protein DedD